MNFEYKRSTIVVICNGRFIFRSDRVLHLNGLNTTFTAILKGLQRPTGVNLKQVTKSEY